LLDCSVLAVLCADLNDGVISVAFSSSGCSLACICSDPSHTIHVYSVPALTAASFEEAQFAQGFQTRVKKVWHCKSKALAVTGIYFDTGPRELPITFGRKHLRFWDISQKARENYQGGMYLQVGDDMGNGFQCCLVMQGPEVYTHGKKQTTNLNSCLSQVTVTGMDNGDIYIWSNSHLSNLPDASKPNRQETRGRRRLSKISSAHKGGVTSLYRSSQGKVHIALLHARTDIISIQDYSAADVTAASSCGA
jgi:hypothetical protein